MKLRPFALERFFDEYEFTTEILLCASDIEPWRLDDLLELASPDQQRRWSELSLGYTHAAGHPLLRAQIAQTYEAVEPDEVLTFSGAEEAIFVMANVLLTPADHAVVVVPTYQSLHTLASTTGAEVSLIPMASDWAIPVEAIEQAIRPETALVVLNSPNNPTGAVADREQLERLTAASAAVGATFLCDEVYRLIDHRPGAPPPAAADLSASAVSLGVMSKSYALAGLRIGWVATHDRELIDRLAGFKDYTTICSSAPSELLAEIALDNADAVLARSRKIVSTNLAAADGFFEKWDEMFRWQRPQGGTTAFPELLGPLGIEAFSRRLVKAEGVLLAPGSLFDWPGNYFRLGLGRTNFIEGLERLDRFAEALSPSA